MVLEFGPQFSLSVTFSAMLRCAQTSVPENFPAGVGSADMSVLERQRAMLQRLYHEQQQHVNSSSSSQTTMPLFHCQSLMNSLPIHHHSLDDNSQNLGFACSEITTTNGSANSSRDQQHAGSTKKRKAEVSKFSNSIELHL